MARVSPKQPDLEVLTVDEMIQSVGTWYHTIELDGRKTPGHYDMEPFVDSFRLPEDLSQTEVIDVGASNGFFSFLFERRGARRVVATDLPKFGDHDFPGWYLERELAKRTVDDLVAHDWDELHGGFTVSHRILGSRVERILTRIYDLPENCPERFDLAFCSNVFVHLRDPVGGMEAIREVLRPGGRAIFATPVEVENGDVSAARFVGVPELCAWWVPTSTGFARMLSMAGFDNAELVGTFEIAAQRGDPCVNTIAVMHCDRGD